MDAQRLSYLLEQYRTGSIQAPEKAELDAWYETLNITDAPFFTGEQPKEQQLNLLLQQLHNSLPQPEAPVLPLKPAARRYNMRWVAAAGIAAAVAGIWWWQQPRSAGTRQLATTQQARPVVHDSIAAFRRKTNTGKNNLQLVLDDGTVAVLSPAASLKYPQQFGSDAREVTIEGRVFFDVAKDKQRPFTVYSAHFATAVLGTSFTIQDMASGLSVKLFSGKVKVRSTDRVNNGWKNDVVLQAGEQLQYNTQKGALAVTHMAATTAAPVMAAKGSVTDSGDEIVFENASLPQVLDSISRFYNISIQYNKAAIERLYFSGAMQKTDAAAVILKAITRMNGLDIQDTEQGYQIGNPQ
jgi:ferric-dicitrate binding protein FerR (iron transport regulator)